jgi:hypothetical protein
MAQSAFFVQECPVCGRPLQIRVEYLGRRLNCDHCGGAFIAAETPEGAPQQTAAPDLIDRAEDLLRRSSMRLSGLPDSSFSAVRHPS